MKTYFIRTFGCQANKSDSERIAGDYQARGYKEAKSIKKADEVIINTCSVRQRAEDRVIGLLHNLDKLNPKPKIILTGCMVHHTSKKLLQDFPMVDQVLPIMEVGFNLPTIRRDKKHAWVPISTGCNSFCTYCIVPFSRGREKSRPIKDILKEIKQLAKSGYTEITLLGQNVNSYGLEKVGIGVRKMSNLPSNKSQYKTFKDKPPFVKLLEKICDIKQIKTLRFLTSNPWDFYDQLIECIAANSKIDRFIYLPVQSGSNKILRRMNRGYTRVHYLRLVNKIKKSIPDVQLGTDIIVGFPGETEQDFKDTLDLVNQVGFKVAFVAQYSPRPHTAANRLYKDDISPQIKKKRWQILDKIVNKDQIKSRPKIV